MTSKLLTRLASACALAGSLLAALPAQAYSGLVIFGDSLSDSGNNAIALSGATTPNTDITSNAFIPAYPYASGAPLPVYSNGPVWATSFAAALGLSAMPSLAGGTNYAFGGAVTGGSSGFPFSLTDQLGMYLGGTGGNAYGDYLYVVAGGGNDARGALAAIAGGADIPSTIGATSLEYATNIGNIVDTLQAAGAQHIVVWNTPNLGLAPAVTAQGAAAAGLASALADTMNSALQLRLTGEAGVSTFDLFGWGSAVAADPAAYGLSNVSDACLLGACDASNYLFWDGIHPSARGHQILAEAMYAAVVPEPETYLLMAMGLAVVGWAGRRRTQRAAH